MYPAATAWVIFAHWNSTFMMNHEACSCNWMSKNPINYMNFIFPNSTNLYVIVPKSNIGLICFESFIGEFQIVQLLNI